MEPPAGSVASCALGKMAVSDGSISTISHTPMLIAIAGDFKKFTDFSRLPFE